MERDSNFAKGCSVATAEPKRAIDFNKPGVWARKLEATRFLAAFVILIAIFTGSYYFGKNIKGIASLGLPIVVLVGAAWIYWVKAMGDKVDEDRDKALDARRDAVEKEEVGRLLGALPKGCFVLHDFASLRRNIDHIVVSPKGIFTIETNSHKGAITFDGEKMLGDGQLFEKDFIKRAWAQAFCIRDLLASQGISAPEPQPVVLFVNADVRTQYKVKGVEIIGRRGLPSYLDRTRNRMNAKEAEKIFDSLRAAQAQMFV
jgi:hypothetical protein